jgi:hypothetical protein
MSSTPSFNPFSPHHHHHHGCHHPRCRRHPFNHRQAPLADFEIDFDGEVLRTRRRIDQYHKRAPFLENLRGKWWKTLAATQQQNRTTQAVEAATETASLVWSGSSRARVKGKEWAMMVEAKGAEVYEQEEETEQQGGLWTVAAREQPEQEQEEDEQEEQGRRGRAPSPVGSEDGPWEMANGYGVLVGGEATVARSVEGDGSDGVTPPPPPTTTGSVLTPSGDDDDDDGGSHEGEDEAGEVPAVVLVPVPVPAPVPFSVTYPPHHRGPLCRCAFCDASTRAWLRREELCLLELERKAVRAAEWVLEGDL